MLQQVDQERPLDPPWYQPFGWLGLLALGWVVWEVTRSPALGAILICLKFGWNDLAAARWLWRCDRVRWRRRALFWLYLAWGVWKITVVAFCMTLGFAAVTSPIAPPAGVQQTTIAFLGTLATALAGLVLTSLFTALAIACAWMGRHRLWLDSAVHLARRLDVWPPSPLCQGRRNRLDSLLITSLLGCGLACLGVLCYVIPRDGPALLVGFALLLLAPVAVVYVREWLGVLVFAEHPDECWFPAENVASH